MYLGGLKSALYQFRFFIRSGHLISIVNAEETSRPLKNWVERANCLFLDDRFFVLCVYFGLVFVLLRVPVGLCSASRDTTARTYCAGNAAAIRFRMRTRL